MIEYFNFGFKSVQHFYGNYYFIVGSFRDLIYHYYLRTVYYYIIK